MGPIWIVMDTMRLFHTLERFALEALEIRTYVLNQYHMMSFNFHSKTRHLSPTRWSSAPIFLAIVSQETFFPTPNSALTGHQPSRSMGILIGNRRVRIFTLGQHDWATN